jgi:RHO1 GDP-GTP exchange protein 1/2
MTERLPESRKLELNGYLTKPTTRLARYPLLLEAVLKHTPDDNPDKTVLPQVVSLVREFLARVNTESGKTENRFNLLQLDQQLVFRPGEEVDLRLKEEGRELVYKGALKKRGGGQGDSGELQVFLFDHALLMVKQKTKHEQFKVYRRVRAILYEDEVYLLLMHTCLCSRFLSNSLSSPLLMNMLVPRPGLCATARTRRARV